MGSGCVVAPGLILTAYHVVQPVDGLEGAPIVVRVMDSGAEGSRVDAELAWHRWDAALLVCRPQDLKREFAPVRWGELTCARPAPAPPVCTAVGLPLAALRRIYGSGTADRHYRGEHEVTGRINVVDNASRTYSLQIESAPRDIRGADSPWQGMSGAGVFCDEALIGLVTDALDGWGNGRLDVLPVRRLLDDRQFCEFIHRAAGTWPRLEPADLDALFDTSPVPAAASSYLLSPRSEVVSFTGLATEMTELVDWCRTGKSVDVAVVHGPGGVGKTRLGVELARRVSGRRPEAERLADDLEAPWAAGFLHLDLPAQQPSPYAMLRHLIRPVLVVVDYAESRLDQVEQLLAALATHQPPGKPVRILLLARSLPAWWERLRARYGTMTNGPVIELSPHALYRQQDPHDAREQAALAFTQRIAGLRRAGIPDDWDPDDIAALVRASEDTPVNEDAGMLAVHMDALAGVLAHTPDGLEDGLSPTQVLIAHETKHWDRAFTAHGLDDDIPPELRPVLVAVQRMARAKDEDQAENAIRTAWDFYYRRFRKPLDADTAMKLLRALRDLYPATGGGYWGGLGPDTLTAALIDGIEEASDEQFLEHILTSPYLAEDQVRHCLSIVARAIPTRPDLRTSVAYVIVYRPERLMPLAEDIAEQLPEDDREAWWDAVTAMQDDLAADQRNFTTEDPADTAEPPAPVEPAGSDDADTQQDTEDHDAGPDDEGAVEPDKNTALTSGPPRDASPGPRRAAWAPDTRLRTGRHPAPPRARVSYVSPLRRTVTETVRGFIEDHVLLSLFIGVSLAVTPVTLILIWTVSS
ncbi:hypothetical protein GTY54_26070 [Streptomyces sp. SID625]|nr:hypothetical protein [Streptomyces sp. SID625]